MITIRNGRQLAVISNGELISYMDDDYEFIHQKGSPGWGHSDTEMFPIIGPTADAAYRVQVPRGNAILDQHGLLRDLEYTLTEENDKAASFEKVYSAGTRVKNAKYPDRSPMQWLIWPFDFRIEKSFVLADDGLKILFSLTGERDMPYMFGYHPAFKLRNSEPFIHAHDRKVGRDEVLAVGSRALLLEGLNEVSLHDERVLQIKTAGFRHFMLWTEVPGMICIEPVTFYPYAVSQQAIHEGFDYLEGKEQKFTVQLIPGKHP